jgi:hypothetical protein
MGGEVLRTQALGRRVEDLETFYNIRRLHSSLGFKSTAASEEDTVEEARVA